MKTTRYQYCNVFVKLWRRRWYLVIPWWTVSIYFNQKDEESDYKLSFKSCWKMSIGLAQGKMNWVYDAKDIFKYLHSKHNLKEKHHEK